MKQGWEIKKLGEVCEIQGGSTPKRTESSFWDNGTYPWFTIEDIREQGHIILDTKQKITKVAWDKMRIFPKDTILLCCTASLGEYAITQIPLSSNQQFNGLMIKDRNYLSPMYLMHYCSTLKNTLLSLSGKATIDFVSAEKVRQIPISIPPLAVQEKIVAELDCLSGVIEKKKQQLKELDALAQSIFYTMFGDPITNEKGWEVKKFEDCYKLSSGNALSAKEIIEGKYPVYGGNGIVGYHHEYNLDGSNIIIGRVGALCGNVRNVIGKAFITDNAFILTKKIENDNVYLHYLLRIHNLRKYAREAMQPVISNAGLKNINIITTPLPLQQEFASKIEAIEKQKELIKESIKEAEELFNSRMDYYFG